MADVMRGNCSTAGNHDACNLCVGEAYGSAGVVAASRYFGSGQRSVGIEGYKPRAETFVERKLKAAFERTSSATCRQQLYPVAQFLQRYDCHPKPLDILAVEPGNYRGLPGSAHQRRQNSRIENDHPSKST